MSMLLLSEDMDGEEGKDGSLVLEKNPLSCRGDVGSILPATVKI